MDPGEYANIYRQEEQHWWYQGMQRITTRLLETFYPVRRNLQILDAGCGTGGAMAYLSAFGQVTGFDLSPLALTLARTRAAGQLVQASVVSLPFSEETFDLVTSFDVLYHQAVPDYQRALGEFYRVLRPGGRLFLRLPAYNWLRGHHDQVVHTAHRFTAGELSRSLEGGQFQVEKLSYANTLLFPLAAASRLTERFTSSEKASDVQGGSSRVERLLAYCLFAEANWLAHYNLPLGLSVLAIARKD